MPRFWWVTYVVNSQARAIELFAQGCKLGHAGSCTAAATYVSDDAAPLRFAQRGCQLKDDRSCDRVAAAERAIIPSQLWTGGAAAARKRLVTPSRSCSARRTRPGPHS